MQKLKFAKGNAKLGKETAIFSLPAGHTCLGAKDCLARANKTTGSIETGRDAVFRCYAASSENLFGNVRKGRWNNYDLLRGKSVAEMVELISEALPRNVKLCRIHQSGDFFNQDYFDAWLIVARKFPAIIFYAYTKALPLWVRRLNCIPSNVKIVASLGGKFDAMIAQHNLRYVKVVFSKGEARKLKLPLDDDDTHAWKGKGSFALLLHGTQPAQTPAAAAWHKIKTEIGGYKSDYFAHYAKSGKMSPKFHKLQEAHA